LIILSFLTLSSFAQSSKEADLLIDKISKRYKKFKSIKADFTYSVESKAEKINEKQKGNIVIKGNKFRLDIAGQTIICDNKTQWTYSKEINEVNIQHYKPKEGVMKLDDIFTMYSKGFVSRIAEVVKENGRELTVIELAPKDKKKNYFKIKLYIEKNNQQIVRSVIFDKNGSIHTYTITNQIPNIKFEDGYFTFNPKKYPGVEINDMR
ncbi:MAG: outer membrane lipoprotein carrier protein LolA, partial [Bacteroidia bacterium]|nr:outer membrane lipoprotein carrier protein LolA [Bacteroidia bacterium]